MFFRANCVGYSLLIIAFSGVSARADFNVGSPMTNLSQTELIQKAKIPGLEIEGPQIDFSKISAKAILLVHWETWCAPCRAEIPALIAIQREYGSRVAIIALTTSPISEINKLLHESIDRLDPNHQLHGLIGENINYNVLRVNAKEDSYLRIFKTTPQVPTIFLLNQNGIVQKMIEDTELKKPFNSIDAVVNSGQLTASDAARSLRHTRASQNFDRLTAEIADLMKVYKLASPEESPKTRQQLMDLYSQVQGFINDSSDNEADAQFTHLLYLLDESSIAPEPLLAQMKRTSDQWVHAFLNQTDSDHMDDKPMLLMLLSLWSYSGMIERDELRKLYDQVFYGHFSNPAATEEIGVALVDANLTLSGVHEASAYMHSSAGGIALGTSPRWSTRFTEFFDQISKLKKDRSNALRIYMSETPTNEKTNTRFIITEKWKDELDQIYDENALSTLRMDLVDMIKNGHSEKVLSFILDHSDHFIIEPIIALLALDELHRTGASLSLDEVLLQARIDQLLEDCVGMNGLLDYLPKHFQVSLMDSWRISNLRQKCAISH
jgi:thiol-disulfide isomerase/thioredoxin